MAIAILVVPAIALANHQFNDVPTAASFHDEVERLVDAGITSGCGGANYCPGNGVTRGQMAQFMTRGLGSAAGGYGELTASEAEEFYVATVALTTGGLSGGTGYVTVDADLQIFDQSGICPCGVIFSIEDTTTLEGGPIGTMVAPAPVAGATAQSGSVNWVFEVPTGTDVEYGLWASLIVDEPPLPTIEPSGGAGTTGAPAEPLLTGSVTAEYSPFGQAFQVPGPLGGLESVDWGGGEVSVERGRRVQDR
jgi:S-layer homology domain